MNFLEGYDLKKTGLKKLTMLLGVFAFTFTAVSAAYSSNVGTESDPLVSKSYVDAQIAQLKSQINTSNASTANTTANTTTQVVTNKVVTEEAGYETVSVAVGKRLMGDDGTEIILRAGKGVVYITGKDGISDLTTGQNLVMGDKVQTNHLLVVPRGDGRGVVVSEAAWFLVKGGYTIE
jgi:hypothetical protein